MKKGKKYEEQTKLIGEMQEYLEGIKNALVAENTLVHCYHCNENTSAILWTTEDKEETYEQNLNHDYNEIDEFVQIRARRTYGICPKCKEKKLLKEKVLEQVPIEYTFNL